MPCVSHMVKDTAIFCVIFGGKWLWHRAKIHLNRDDTRNDEAVLSLLTFPRETGPGSEFFSKIVVIFFWELHYAYNDSNLL